MAGFGSVVQVGTTVSDGGSANEYLYDDPLGGGNDFDDDDSSDEDEGDDKKDRGGSGDDEDVPVIDLFAGNFAAFGDQSAEGDIGDVQGSGSGGDDDEDQGGWANFDDAAFASAGMPEPTPLAPTDDGKGSSAPTSIGDTADTEDVFASTTPHLVDSLADDDDDDNGTDQNDSGIEGAK
jgi:hypothetical protein